MSDKTPAELVDAAIIHSANGCTPRISLPHGVISNMERIASRAHRIVKNFKNYNRALSDAERDLRDAVNDFYGTKP